MQFQFRRSRMGPKLGFSRKAPRWGKADADGSQTTFRVQGSKVALLHCCFFKNFLYPRLTSGLNPKSFGSLKYSYSDTGPCSHSGPTEFLGR